jgi:hypothetical protein
VLELIGRDALLAPVVTGIHRRDEVHVHLARLVHILNEEPEDAIDDVLRMDGRERGARARNERAEIESHQTDPYVGPGLLDLDLAIVAVGLVGLPELDEGIVGGVRGVGDGLAHP